MPGRCGNGTNEMAASLLFLRSAVTDSLRRSLGGHPERLAVLRAFDGAGRMGIHADHSSMTALPREKRMEIFKRLQTVAEEFGLTLHICACKNPDLTQNVCRIAGCDETMRPQ